jgi:hypothetical protein
METAIPAGRYGLSAAIGFRTSRAADAHCTTGSPYASAWRIKKGKMRVLPRCELGQAQQGVPDVAPASPREWCHA